MTINGCSFDLDFSGDADRAFDVAEDVLGQLKYKVNKRKEKKIEFKFSGKFLESDPAKMNHSVTVEEAEGALRFTYTTGLRGSRWRDSDIEWAKSQAQKVLDAIS